jgi:catechol 2,3-dioxygenase-like lactoylglutathione lyase family enzyme
MCYNLMMIDHVTLSVADLSRSITFYAHALSPLGLKELSRMEGVYCGFGKNSPFFFVGIADAEHPASTAVHIAFTASSKSEVELFYKNGLEAGGKTNGAPDYRTAYHVGYYAAYLLDPDGNNVEVVFRERAVH